MSKLARFVPASSAFSGYDPLLTEKQTAQMLNVSVSTLQKHRHYGTGLPFVKIGKAVRYSLSKIQAFIAAHQIQPR